MACHFARWTPDWAGIPAQHLPPTLIRYAAGLPDRRRRRYLASRTLLAQLMLHVYGITSLPELTVTASGRPCFVDPQLPDFSIAYTGNIVGILLADEEGAVGLAMDIFRAHSRQLQKQFSTLFSSGEKAWINAQNDPDEAAAQLWMIRQSILKLPDNDPSQPLRLFPASGRLRSEAFPDIQAISDAEEFMVWSCARTPGSERLHLWQYEGGDRWVSITAIEGKKMGPRTLKLISSLPEKRREP
ncbi:phosphopantetheinyl transferase [Erwinia sp. HDF1-3R]|uniref:4'-phosphopantetheinyl transferase family protein n=1 Tax=Erwinia sp. HDF1-3R TaxID=3141543 RepID=UPI0031F48F2D